MDFLKSLRKDIKVVVRVRDLNVAEELWDTLARAGFKNRRNRFRFVSNEGQKMKKWGRDPFIVLRDPENQLYTIIPAYPGDHRIADLLMNTNTGIDNLVRADIPRLPTWTVEGGSVSADEIYLYAGNSVIYQSRQGNQKTVHYTRQEVIDNIETVTGRKLIILASTDLHSDRYHLPVGKTSFGERTSLLADPVLALRIIASLSKSEREVALKKILEFGKAYKNLKFLKTDEGVIEKKWLDDWLNEDDLTKFLSITERRLANFKQSPYVQSLDQAEAELKKNGIAVVRIPALSHSYEYEEWTNKDGKLDVEIKTFYFPFGLFYTNAIQDSHGGVREVVIPKYGIRKLDEAAKKVYESLGAFTKIHQVRSVIEGTQGGGPRCRVQVFGFPDEARVKIKK